MARILIAGVFGGIGNALFNLLSTSGHELFAVGRNAKELKLLQENNKSLIDYAVADFAEPSEIKNQCLTLFQNYQFDAFCYCSGISYISSVRKIKYSDNLKLFNINFFSFVELLQLLVRNKPRSQRCRVAVVSSISSLIGAEYGGIYSASKAALDSFIKSSSKELLGFNVSINSLQPGYVNTKLLDLFGTHEDMEDLIKASQIYGLISPEETAVELEYMLTKMPWCVTGSGRVMGAGLL